MSGPAMSFCEYAMFPEVPTVAAVRMILAFVCGDSRFEQGVTEGDRNAFGFCQGNAKPFIYNAWQCADVMLVDAQYHKYDVSTAEGQQLLDQEITRVLIGMTLARAAPKKRSELESALREMGPWDDHKVTMLLVHAL